MAKVLPALLAAVLATILAVVAGRGPGGGSAADGQHAVVQAWAKRLSEELTDLANSVTRYQRVHDSYKKATAAPRNGTALLAEVVRNVQTLMQRRVHQVQEIRKAAEKLVLQEEREFEVPMPYLGVKDMETTSAPSPETSTTPEPPADAESSARSAPTTTTAKPWLRHVDAFPGGSLVNTSLSAVHVPATVYDGRWINGTEHPEELQSTGAEVQRVIELTEALDEVFISNMRKDRTTSWQFFAHHIGVMRQFPASKWNKYYHEDYYDARLRPWYLGAATSPKDVVILLDNSGSIKMTEPSKLSQHVVRTLLDTLGPDDFVNILLFEETTYALVPGLDDKLIPATSANVRELKRALDVTNPSGMANLSLALTTAFILLEKYRRRSLGAGCNQAVMLVTDLVPEHEEGIFAMHNWPELGKAGATHARVFTFLVGDAEDEAREAKWMACANMGWHLSIRLHEQREAIRYIPVMARPLILQGLHPAHWSHMYADVTVPGITDLLWRNMERDEQLRKVTPFCFKHAEMHPPPKKHYLGRLPITDRELGQTEEFMITVSVAVRNMSTHGSKNAGLLGVAGVDVPLSQITKFISPHKVGVNAYVFMVNNNGLIVFHPELRSRYNGILKPGFNSVDMTELEQEAMAFPRNISRSMREFRELVVNQTSGSVVLEIKQTYENYHRVTRLSRRYFFQGIENSPYSLVLAYPEEYGSHRIQPDSNSSLNWDRLSRLLGADRWQVHPKWTYCGVPGRHGLKRLNQPRAGCDGDLVTALAHDADVTRWYPEWNMDWSKWKRWEVSVAYMATHSGLTRWITMPRNTVMQDTSSAYESFEEVRGPDEVWYKRAVEAAANEASESGAAGAAGSRPLGAGSPHWVFSVPLVDDPGADVYSEYNAAYDPDDPWASRRAGLADEWKGYPRPNLTREEEAEEVGAREVTATAAVFKKKTPAAAVGLRFPQAKLQELFEEITTTLNCPSAVKDAGPPCGDTCASDSLDCYLVDEHGIVIADEDGVEAGRPLARVNANLMARLEVAQVFQRVTVYDYQGVCRRLPFSAAGLPPSVSTGACWAAVAALWWGSAQGQGQGDVLGLGRGLAAAWLLSNVKSILGGKIKDASTTPEYRLMLQSALAPFRVNKTSLQLCDMKVDLHRAGQGLHKQHHQPLSCEGRSFAAAAVPGTNLILVTALRSCGKLELLNPLTTTPMEVKHSTAEGVHVGPFRKADLVLPRRRPAYCFREHVAERDIVHCGRSAGMSKPLDPLSMVFIFTVIYQLLDGHGQLL